MCHVSVASSCVMVASLVSHRIVSSKHNLLRSVPEIIQPFCRELKWIIRRLLNAMTSQEGTSTVVASFRFCVHLVNNNHMHAHNANFWQNIETGVQALWKNQFQHESTSPVFCLFLKKKKYFWSFNLLKNLQQFWFVHMYHPFRCSMLAKFNKSRNESASDSHIGK